MKCLTSGVQISLCPLMISLVVQIFIYGFEALVFPLEERIDPLNEIVPLSIWLCHALAALSDFSRVSSDCEPLCFSRSCVRYGT